MLFFTFFLMSSLRWLQINEKRALNLEFRNHWKLFQEQLGMEAPFLAVRSSDKVEIVKGCFFYKEILRERSIMQGCRLCLGVGQGHSLGFAIR